MTDAKKSEFHVPNIDWLPNLGAVTAWARLWWPELLVAAPAGVVAFREMHPHSSAPWPGLAAYYRDPEAWTAWRVGLYWPDWWVLVLTAAAVTALVGTVVMLDFGRCIQRRRQRKIAYRWELTPAGKHSKLRNVRATQGVVTADCVVTLGSWADLEKALDPDSGTFLRELYVDRKWEAPVRAGFTAAGYSNHSRTRGVTLSFIPLGDPWSLPTYEKPAQGLKFMVGYTVQGSHADADDEGRLWIDLEATPHVAVRGTSGVGKGFFIRLLEIQALYAGHLLLLLDGGNSPEHAAGDSAATFWRPMLDTDSRVQRLQAAIDALETLIKIINLRSQLGRLFFANGVTKSSRWTDMPEDVRRWQPPIGVIIDETTILLGKTGDPVVDRLQDRLRFLVGSEVLRGGRKFEAHILPISDQTSTYTSTLARADMVQAEHVIVLGQFDQAQAQAATGVKLPKLPNGIKKLAGFYVEKDNPNYAELRIPPNTEQELRRAAEWVGGGPFLGRKVIEATPRPTPASPAEELAQRCTDVDGHLICRPLPGQKKATIQGRPAVNVAWFAETGEWPTPAHNLRSTCNVEHCVSPRCRHEWERSADSAQPMSEETPT